MVLSYAILRLVILFAGRDNILLGLIASGIGLEIRVGSDISRSDRAGRDWCFKVLGCTISVTMSIVAYLISAMDV